MNPNLDLGQHFMIDKELLKRIADSITLQPQDTLLEIGSGTGNLTKHLLKKTAHFLCVEYDSRLPSPDPRVTYIQENILDVLHTLSAQVVVGNLPYHICEPLFLKLLDIQPKQIVVVTGLSFAKKLLQETSIGYYVRNHYTVSLQEEIPASAFSPPPRVKSALLVLTKKPIDSPLLEELRKHPKQKIKNFFLQHCQTVTKNELRKLLTVTWANTPAYQLSTAEFKEVYALLKRIENL